VDSLQHTRIAVALAVQIFYNKRKFPRVKATADTLVVQMNPPKQTNVYFDDSLAYKINSCKVGVLATFVLTLILKRMVFCFA